MQSNRASLRFKIQKDLICGLESKYQKRHVSFETCRFWSKNPVKHRVAFDWMPFVTR